jgi:hypothetical protein
MTDELTPAYDRDTGQVVLEGLPTGAAGGAGLVPAAGLELVFDRADGRLSRVAIDIPEPGGPIDSGATAGLTGIFGQSAPETVQAAATGRGRVRALSPDRRLSASWSRLARLDAARDTSPVAPASALWAAEAAQLAEQGGLHARARAEACKAVAGLAELLGRRPGPEPLLQAALAVANLAEADEPEGAERLREIARQAPIGSSEQWIAEHANVPERLGDLERRLVDTGWVDTPGLQWSLDPVLVAGRALLPGLSPLTDVIVHCEVAPDRVVVEALRAPEARDDTVSRCRVRLVDPAARRVLGVAAFRAQEAAAWVRAEICPPFPADELSEAWVEVVDDEHRPVQGMRLRRMRRALRWADTALRSEQCPRGLAPQFATADWSALAFRAWERCRADWQAAGDTDRAFLCAVRLAVAGSQAHRPEAPSRWAAELADRPRLRERAFLAEALGC